MKFRITSYEAATECMDRLCIAFQVLKELDDKVGPQAYQTLWAWLHRRDKLNSADLLVVREITVGIASLLVAAHREVQAANELGCEIPSLTIRGMALRLAEWSRGVASPRSVLARDAGLRGIELLFKGDKETKCLINILVGYIETINRQVQTRGSQRNHWPCQEQSAEEIVETRASIPTKTSPQNKGGRPRNRRLSVQYAEIKHMVESLGTLEEACDAYNRTYGTKIKPEAVRKWFQRHPREETQVA